MSFTGSPVQSGNEKVGDGSLKSVAQVVKSSLAPGDMLPRGASLDASTARVTPTTAGAVEQSNGHSNGSVSLSLPDNTNPVTFLKNHSG